MENNQNPESFEEEYTPLSSQAMMNLASSQENKLKERERLQVALVEEKVGKLVSDLRGQFEKELDIIKHDFELKSQKLELAEAEMRRDNQRLREELKEAQEQAQVNQQELSKFRLKTFEAVNKDRERIKNLETRSLWDMIRGR